jgi:hypothetical protein
VKENRKIIKKSIEINKKKKTKKKKKKEKNIKFWKTEKNKIFSHFIKLIYLREILRKIVLRKNRFKRF